MTQATKSQAENTTTASSLLLAISFCIVIGGLGALANVFAIPYLQKVHLLLGNTAYIVVAMRLKPRFALFTSFIVVSPLWYIWGHPYGYITFCLEAWFVAQLRSKGWYVLFADLLYWLIIGMPLTAIIIWHMLPNPFDYLIFATLKQGFNAILYTGIAGILVFIFNKKLVFGSYGQTHFARGLRSQLVYAIMLISAIAVVVSTQLGSQQLINNELKLMRKTLEDSANAIQDITNLFIEQHKDAIGLTASLITNHDDSKQRLLSEVHQHQTRFKTMLIADKQGEIIAASPIQLLSALRQTPDNIKKSINDRLYFKKTMELQQLYVSPVFQGRGFGNDIIVAICAPWYDFEQSPLPAGIVQGTIKANIAEQLSLAKFGEQSVDIVITDQQNKIIFASHTLAMEPLSAFHFKTSETAIEGEKLTIGDHQYYFSRRVLISNWHVYALIDEAMILGNIEQQFSSMFLILVFTLMLASVMAMSFGNRLTKPLLFIIKQIRRFEKDDQQTLLPMYMDSTREIAEVYQTLVSDKQQVQQIQNDLEDKVLSRTQALNKANERLQKLAHKDGLTHVYNRHYLDENFSIIRKAVQRSKGTLSLVMIDIDWFKKINDTYGHITGDQCLQVLVQIIEQVFARESDIIVRYGGEEFLILLPNITLATLEEKLTHLKDKVAKNQFVAQDKQIFQLTISIGAIIAEAEYSTKLRDWVKVADDALYYSKETGRNRITIENCCTHHDA